MATDRSLLSAILRIFIDVVFRRYRSRSRTTGAECGAVAFIQRFDSALNVNIHFHVLVLDGVYVGDKDQLSFSNGREPTDEELKAIAKVVAVRVKRLLVRRGLLDDFGWRGMEDAVLPVQERLRFGWLLDDGRVVHDEPLDGTGRPSSAEFAGLSIHAGVRVSANDKKGLERLVRYVARPPLAHDQLEEVSDGRIAFRLGKPRASGATHAFLAPQQLIRRLASLIPHAGQNLIRYFGILGPAAKRRIDVVPCPRIDVAVSPNGAGSGVPTTKQRGIDWASLLRRVWDIDALACACGGRIRFRSVIEDPAAIRRILLHLGLSAEAPEFALARAPP